jgi:phosphopantothenoylcysteine synthetase/decarboxylase
LKVLITAGGTEEPIDGVRRLTNLSTGATGAVLARRLAARGAEVVLLRAARAVTGDGEFQREAFATFDELEASLRRLLGEHDFDVVVHAAAVGDYRVAAIEVDGVPWEDGARGKIGSGHEVTLHLRPNPKLIDSLKAWSRNANLTVVGFKLTDDPEPEHRLAQVRALLGRDAVDLVVHNDLAGIADGRHLAEIFDRSGRLASVTTKDELADALSTILESGGTS